MSLILVFAPSASRKQNKASNTPLRLVYGGLADRYALFPQSKQWKTAFCCLSATPIGSNRVGKSRHKPAVVGVANPVRRWSQPIPKLRELPGFARAVVSILMARNFSICPELGVRTRKAGSGLKGTDDWQRAVVTSTTE